jgi:hypothetical protein
MAEATGGSLVRVSGWPEIEDDLIRKFLCHCADARRGAIVPSQGAIDPTVIGPCLPNVFMYRFVPEMRDFVLAIVGEEVKAFWREPLKGRSMRDVLGQGAGDMAIARGLLVVETPALLYTRSSTITRPGAFHSVTRLTAPLLKEGGDVFGTIGISVYTPVPSLRGQPPERVAIHDLRPLQNSFP